MTATIDQNLAPALRRRSPGRPLRQRIVPYLYVLPAALFVVLFLLYPMVLTAWRSLTRFDGISDPVYIGFENFRTLFQDPYFLLSLRNTVIWTVAAVVFPVTLGLVFALAFSRVRWGGFFKTVIYLPATISAAAAGILFSFVFNYDNGVLNMILRAIGLGDLASRWLFDVPTNTFAMIATYTWQQTGLNMMLFLVGLQGLPPEPIEAAKIEGCTGWGLVRRIILPMLMPYVVITTLLAIVNGFKVFDLIWVMTQGGPGRASETLAVTMYREGFILFNQGYSASIAVVISVVALAFSYFYLRSVLEQEARQ
ncbi:sugar ABC transporter permease [Kaistia geumhonensis]|uniref:Multiple sugar transport system permease protein n=1 Tax=Kaistia geumhonensis TaxID=410839 RepID=A0ABU0M7F5_9HYPH|nr:sugar ABC transporter permease [Kaistia geumhonensis]MCX5477930.1 sugar ABC transporter permease [Kaistia geumhonensis]MDQ0516857.1 multiple sugar transport system permease protein [Kaistia geumhonensis]